MTGAYDAVFTIDTALLNPPVEFDADAFIVENVAGSFAGVAGSADTVSFNTASFDGGLTIQTGDTFTNLWGDQLFTGTTAMPFLREGPFTLRLDGDVGQAVVLNVARTTTSPVPEPATWVMMIVGFGAIGAAARRTRRAVRFAI